MLMMKGSKSCMILLCSLALVVAFYDDTVQAQDFDLPFSLDGSSNDCYVQCPMECPTLNLDMVDCVVYCKMKCACPADDTECATQAMDKMQKAADERESVIGPDEELDEAEESPESETLNDISQAGASDSDAAFSPDAFAPESDEIPTGDLAFAPEMDTTTSFVIEMDASSPSPSTNGAPTPSEEADAPAGYESVTPQSAPVDGTPRSSDAPTPSGFIAPMPQYAAASPAPQNAAAPGPRNAAAAPWPNAPSPA